MVLEEMTRRELFWWSGEVAPSCGRRADRGSGVEHR